MHIYINMYIYVYKNIYICIYVCYIHTYPYPVSSTISIISMSTSSGSFRSACFGQLTPETMRRAARGTMGFADQHALAVFGQHGAWENIWLCHKKGAKNKPFHGVARGNILEMCFIKWRYHENRVMIQ